MSDFLYVWAWNILIGGFLWLRGDRDLPAIQLKRRYIQIGVYGWLRDGP